MSFVGAECASVTVRLHSITHAAELINVSYDAAREFYKQLNSSFADDPVYKPN